MRWKAPWSVGFPSWRLECSVMSTKYLGEKFDIHGGGNDLKFPHHENEIAQNYGACGHAPCNYWLHANMLLMNGKKMSKSDGNSIMPGELFTGQSPHLRASRTRQWWFGFSCSNRITAPSTSPTTPCNPPKKATAD